MPESVAARGNSGYGARSVLIDASAVDVNVEGCISLYVETAGDVEMGFYDGSSDTWAVPAGGYVRMLVKTVKTGGTTAGGIHAIY